MKTTTTMTVALAAVLALVAIGPTPVAAEFDPDCDDEYEITTTVDQRHLKIGKEETGLAEVPAEVTMELTVELVTSTSGAKLSFEVFEDHPVLGCTTTLNSPDCDDEISVTPNDPVETCDLKGPSSGSRVFFIHFVNTGTVDLDYEVSIEQV